MFKNNLTNIKIKFLLRNTTTTKQQKTTKLQNSEIFPRVEAGITLEIALFDPFSFGFKTLSKTVAVLKALYQWNVEFWHTEICTVPMRR